jgi:hypothetical protein
MFVYPSATMTDQDKLAYCYRAIELLRLEHNSNGDNYRSGLMTGKQWEDYLKDWEKRFQNIDYQKNILVDKLGQNQIGDNLTMRQTAATNVQTMKNSTTWDNKIDIKSL